MKIQVKASIELTLDDVKEALRAYITANGHDLADASIDLTLRNDGAVVTSDNVPTAEEKPKPLPTKVLPKTKPKEDKEEKEDLQDSEDILEEDDKAFGQDELDKPEEETEPKGNVFQRKATTTPKAEVASSNSIFGKK